jgi:hypothetical protein
MKHEPLSRSATGRILLLTGAANLLAMATLAFSGPGGHVTWILAALPLASILSCLFAVGLSVGREDDSTALLLLGLPFLGGLSYAGLSTASQSGTVTGVALMLIGVTALLLALPRVRSAGSEPSPAGAHA